MIVVPFARHDGQGRHGSRRRREPTAAPAPICAMPVSTLVAYAIRRSRGGASREEIASLIGRLRRADDPAAAVLANHLEPLLRIRIGPVR